MLRERDLGTSNRDIIRFKPLRKVLNCYKTRECPPVCIHALRFPLSDFRPRVPEAEKIGGAMMSVQRIDDLIEAAWNVMEDEFNIRAVYRWKKEAFEFLADEFGPDHYYTQYFKNHIRDLERQNILTGGGILTAAKEVISDKVEN
jgi:hypothetical protein